MTTKRKRGRPPLVEGERTVRVPVRMPESVRALVTEAAERAGVPIARYMADAAERQARRDARR